MPRRSARTPKESLRLTLESAATPEVVEHVAAMFNATLRQVDPELRVGDVTMRVDNYQASAEIRGWHDGGERAVRLTAELVDNAIEAVQKHAELAPAARTMAVYAAKLTVHRPKFWRNDVELRAVDDVFIRTMRAAGQTTSPRDDGDSSGDTTVYASILRVGRSHESGPLQARIRLHGVATEVDVADDLAAHVWEVARTGDVVSLRLRGKWVETSDGELRLNSEDFERMLDELDLLVRGDAWNERAAAPSTEAVAKSN